MSYLYHGSSVSGLKRLEPHKSTHGTYVYATPYKELTIVFSGRAGGDMTYSLFRTNNEPWQLVERVPNGFEAMFSNSASIYTIDDSTFKDINTGFSEVVSSEGVDILKEERIENVYQEIIKLEQKGVIKIYHYPDKPHNIPVDDSDLLAKKVEKIKRDNIPLNYAAFEHLLFLHPNLLDKVNEIGKLMDENFKPIAKEDLIGTYEKYIMLQMINPDEEYFLKSGLTSICETYPELASSLEEKSLLFSKSKEEKLEALKNILVKDIKNIPPEIIEGYMSKYKADERSFSEIGKEVLATYRKINVAETLVNKPVNEDVLKNSILLIGPMGAGKTTVGRSLSSELDMPRISLDNKEMLQPLYQQRDKFNSFKEFEFFLTSSVLTGIETPTVIDFGAGHSVYEDPIMFMEIKSLINKFDNVVLLMPSEDKEVSLRKLSELKGIEPNSDKYQTNKHFVEMPCNYELATITEYTNGKTPDEISTEIISHLQTKDLENISHCR